MAQRGGISPLVIKRLPRYYRFLEELKSDGVNRISSGELARRMGLTASQIRQDLNCFGGFGQQGIGYSVEELKNSIAEILGLNEHRKTVLIGAGNLGRAIATHMQFERFGFRLIGVFDKKESLAGQIIKDMPIRHIAGLENFCRDNHPTAAILCIPKAEAEQLTKQLIKLGVKGFWNFAHYDIAVNHPGVAVENVHLSDSLMTLCYNIKALD